MEFNRRQVLQLGGASLAALSSGGLATGEEEGSDNAFGPLCVFAKPLQWLTPEQLADFLDEQQWDGIEATLRSGGQVDPQRVTEELPKLVDALQQKEKRIVMFASDILSADQPLTETTLRAAAKEGIRYYRMSYYHYDLKKPILPQLDEFTRQIESLVAINRELGMTALYQNHAGSKNCGAGLWDLYRLVAEQPTEQVAIAFDIRHATVEAGMSWPVHWEMLKPFVGALYFKDFRWNGSKVENVPLGEGIVQKDFYKALRKQPMVGVPVSVHMEYVNHRDESLIEKSKSAIGDDRRAIRNLLGV